MRALLYSLLLSVGLIAWGAQGVYEWANNRHQTVTSYASFEKRKPSSGWFKISDAHLRIPGAMWTVRGSSGKDKVFVPLLPLGKARSGAKIHVLVQISDDATKQLVDEVGKFSNNTPTVQVLDYLRKNRARLYPIRPVEGMIKFGIHDLQSKEREKLVALNSDLAPDFVVLEENAHPSGGISLLMLVLGVGLLALCLRNVFGRIGASRVPQGMTPGTSAPSASNMQPPPMTGGSAG